MILEIQAETKEAKDSINQLTLDIKESGTVLKLVEIATDLTCVLMVLRETTIKRKEAMS